MSLFSTNSRENSEITKEATRMMNSEIASQMSNNSDELKAHLNSPFSQVIYSAIAGKVLPTIQNSLGTQENGW